MDMSNSTGRDFVTNLDLGQIQKNPILDIAARFWDEERYQAFRICYRSMRIIDDLVDDRKAKGLEISDDEREQYSRMISDWIEPIKRRRPDDALQHELVATIERFKIPIWPWEKLASAMLYDLNHDSFPTFRTFLQYSEGAAVAPASVFMHLCGVARQNGGYFPPYFDIQKTARPLAIFSYLVHIIRDFQKDQKNHLNYFASDILVRHGLSGSKLREIAETGEIGQSFRNLMVQYLGFAEYYCRKARETIDRILPLLKSRYRLSLEIIYNLYSQIFERINPRKGSFTSSELNPGPEEIRDRIDRTIAAFQSS